MRCYSDALYSLLCSNELHIREDLEAWIKIALCRKQLTPQCVDKTTRWLEMMREQHISADCSCDMYLEHLRGLWLYFVATTPEITKRLCSHWQNKDRRHRVTNDFVPALDATIKSLSYDGDILQLPEMGRLLYFLHVGVPEIG